MSEIFMVIKIILGTSWKLLSASSSLHFPGYLTKSSIEKWLNKFGKYSFSWKFHNIQHIKKF